MCRQTPATGITVPDSSRCSIPYATCVRSTCRFCGSHTEVPEHYDKLLAYIAEHSLRISGFSREITLIDYGVTNDPEKFVTEICIPVDE